METRAVDSTPPMRVLLDTNILIHRDKASSPGDKNTHNLFSFQPVRVARIGGYNLGEPFSIRYKRR
jgi:hypothetical protein